MRVVRRNRALSVLVSLGYLLGYLLVFAHFVGEQHAECVEHGGAHHVEAVDDTARAPLGAGIDASPSIVDDHCHQLNTVRDHIAGPARPTASLLELPPTIAAASRALPAEPHRLAVWRYAPKQSPPSVS